MADTTDCEEMTGDKYYLLVVWRLLREASD